MSYRRFTAAAADYRLPMAMPKFANGGMQPPSSRSPRVVALLTPLAVSGPLLPMTTVGCKTERQPSNRPHFPESTQPKNKHHDKNSTSFPQRLVSFRCADRIYCPAC